MNTSKVPQSGDDCGDAIGEIATTLESLRSALEELFVRGTRVSSGEDLRSLSSIATHLNEEGASHLAERATRAVQSIRDDSPGAGADLLRTFAALRVYERVLSLETAELELSRAFVAPELAPSEQALTKPASTRQLSPLPADFDKQLARSVARAVASALEELASTGLIAASELTQKKIDLALKETSRLRLSRLAAALRYISDEIGRYRSAGLNSTKGELFSRRRLVFFAGRAWLFSRLLGRALEQEDAESLRALVASPVVRPIDKLELVTLGVAKRVAAKTQVAYEWRLRALGDTQLRSTTIIWSNVFAYREGVPAEAFLHLPQPQKFQPRALLDGAAVAISNAALTEEDGNQRRLVLGPQSAVQPSASRFTDWESLFDFDPKRAIDRVRSHRVSPLDLEVELNEDVMLSDYSIGAPNVIEDRGQVVYPTLVGDSTIDLVAPMGPDAAPLRRAIDELALATTKNKLFGVMHYELGRIVFQPMSVLRDDGPTYLQIGTEKIDTATLLKSMTF